MAYVAADGPTHEPSHGLAPTSSHRLTYGPTHEPGPKHVPSASVDPDARPEPPRGSDAPHDSDGSEAIGTILLYRNNHYKFAPRRFRIVQAMPYRSRFQPAMYTIVGLDGCPRTECTDSSCVFRANVNRACVEAWLKGSRSKSMRNALQKRSNTYGCNPVFRPKAKPSRKAKAPDPSTPDTTA